MDTSQEDRLIETTLKKDAIKFFKDLINHRTRLGVDTRPVNFAGNIGRHMSKDLKKWFLNKYPNNSDYVKFFLENDCVFRYDCLSGNVTIITDGNHSIARPQRLSQLEELCTQTNIDLRQISRTVFELELLIVVIKRFRDSHKMSNEISVKEFGEEFCKPNYGLMFRELASIVANPETGQPFETDLINYLEANYTELLAVDTNRQTIRLQLQIIESPKKLNEILDDTIYKVFEQLLAKFLDTKGSKDVDLLYAAIERRHPFIVDYIFGQNKTTAYEYTLLDFVKFNDKRFVMRPVVGADGKTLRLIDIRSPEVVAKPEPKDCADSDSVYASDNDDEEDDEIYNSDEIYCSDNEEVEADDREELQMT